VASFESWLETNWFNLVQTVSIVVGLLFAGLSLRRDARSRRLSNLLVLKQEHRELWNTIHEKPGLARILQKEVDLVATPITNEEETFLRQLIVHVAVAWELIQDGTPLNLAGLRRDVAGVFSLPLPKLAWERAREAQNRRFMKFVDRAVATRLKRDKDRP